MAPMLPALWVEDNMANDIGNSCRVIPFKPRRRGRSEQRVAGSFELLAKEWPDVQLPWLRVAAELFAKDDASLAAAIRNLSRLEEEDGAVSAMFKHWQDAKRDLDEMRDALDVTLNRCLDVLERTGNVLDDPPLS
jgi:hypothetical protein